MKTPLKQEGGKWGFRDPATNWSQKEKLAKPKEHAKVVKEGYKHALPLIAAAVPAPFVGRFGGKSILNAIKTGIGMLSGGLLNPAVGGGLVGGGMANFLKKTKILKKLQSKLTKVKQKYPSSLPKDWNKGGSKKTFENLKEFGPSKETINYLKNYSKDFGPIFKEMGKK